MELKQLNKTKLEIFEVRKIRGFSEKQSKRMCFRKVIHRQFNEEQGLLKKRIYWNQISEKQKMLVQMSGYLLNKKEKSGRNYYVILDDRNKIWEIEVSRTKFKKKDLPKWTGKSS